MYRIPIYQVKLVRDGSQAAERKHVSTPSVAAGILHAYLDGADREHFVVLLLNTQHRAIGLHTVTVGTLDASLVHPREVFKPAILASSASVILAHNHPSGEPSPSAEDRAITRQLRNAGELLGINVADHIILGEAERYYSFLEHGDLA
ncbi:MAG: DNA repair protein RadC [Gemmatimonadetes bacterium]|nr:DNA repair protein RadC [Gemmatimonadota bacterium]